MTRKRCIKGVSVVVLVTVALQAPIGVERPVAAQASGPAPRVSAGGQPGAAGVERIVGREAWTLLEQRVIAKHPKAWESALRTKEARGWRKTDRVVAMRIRPATVLTKVQAQAFDIGDALLIEWEWECDPYSVCGTYYFESHHDGGNIVYDAQFVPTGEWSGYAPWAGYIGGNPGRDGRRQASHSSGGPGLRLAATAPPQRGTGDDYCPGAIWEWNQCMRDCLARRHEAAMIGTSGSAGASLVSCARAIRPGPLVAMGLSYLGCLTVSAGAGALASFSAAHWWSPCDALGGPCGPRPC